MKRRFVESIGFSEDRNRLERARELSHDDLVALEQSILADPFAGDLVPGTGGLRKIRLGQRRVRRGKSGGGVRVHYLDLLGGRCPTWSRFSESEMRTTSRQPSAVRSPRW